MMKQSICGLLVAFYTQCYAAISHFTANSMLNSMSDLIQIIKKGSYSCESDEWISISSDAKDLISKLIVVDPKERLIPSAALKHRWFEDVPDDIQTQKSYNSNLQIQNNLKKNKRKLTKSNINVNVSRRMSFNMDIKNELENYEAVNVTRHDIDSENSIMESDPPSIEKILED